MDKFDNFDEQQIISCRLIPGITPDFIISEINSNPILLHQWKNNSKQHHKRFIQVMMRAPSRSDCPGYIYGFRKKQGYDWKHERYEIKMGRTKLQVPQNRIFQWQKDDNHQYIQIFTVRSESNVKLEALVHLLFAYARKTLIINGKNRVEWFQFAKKIPTAAITNLLNLLMQKVHDGHFKQIVTSINVSNYQSLLERLLFQNNFNRQKQKIVTFGLAKTGKTTLSNILFNIPMISEKQERQWKISQSQQIKENRHLLEITSISQNIKNNRNHELLQRYFTQWYAMCNTEMMLPILIVKQSDIESSMMTGLFQGLKLVNQYIKPEKRCVVVINRASTDFNQQTAQRCIQEYRPYLTEKKRKDLQLIYPVIMKSAHSQGIFPPTNESQQIYEKIVEYQSKGNLGTVDLQLNSELLKQCHFLIQIAYPHLQKLYESKFVQKIKLVQDQDYDVQCLHYLKTKLQFLKNEIQPSQQMVHEQILSINDFLAFSEKENISSFFYVFCECVANKTLSHSLIFDDLQNRISAKEVEIIYKQNTNLNKFLQNFKQSIEAYLKKGNRLLINQLKDLIKQDVLLNIRNILESIVDVNSKQNSNSIAIRKGNKMQQAQKTEQAVQLVESIRKVVDILKKMDIYGKTGLRFESAVGRIKQSIFIALKAQPKNIEDNSDILQVEKRYMPISKEQQKSKQMNNTSASHYILSKNSMSELVAELQTLEDGKTFVNLIKGQFVVDISNLRVNHNLAILAKSIKISSEFKISFKKVNELVERKEKLKFVVMSEKIDNSQNMQIPKTSPFGRVVELMVINGDIKVINHYKTKEPENIEGAFYRQLQAIYVQKIK